MTERLRKIVVTAIAIMVFVSGVAASAAEPEVKTHGAGWVEYIEGVRVVHLSGTPKEMGEQHGALLKDEIGALLKYFFEERTNIFGASRENIAMGAQTLTKFIPEEYLEEMRGISAGSGIEYERLLLENVFLDVVSANWVGQGPKCSNFAALGSAAKDGVLVHGRNLEWSADEKIIPANTVFIYTPKDGVPFISISWPGMVGTLTGMNAEQISMGEMTSISSEATLEGMPIMMLLRKLLQESGTLDDAFQVLERNKRTTGYNVLVTDGKENSGFIAEMTSKRIVRLGPEDNILVHANHFVNKSLFKTQETFQSLYDKGKKSDTYYRYGRLRELLTQNKGQVDVAAAQRFLADKLDPVEKKETGNLDNTVCQKNTLLSVVMLPQKGELYVALKSIPAPDGGFVKIKFDPAAESPSAKHPPAK